MKIVALEGARLDARPVEGQGLADDARDVDAKRCRSKTECALILGGFCGVFARSNGERCRSDDVNYSA